MPDLTDTEREALDEVLSADWPEDDYERGRFLRRTVERIVAAREAAAVEAAVQEGWDDCAEYMLPGQSVPRPLTADAAAAVEAGCRHTELPDTMWARLRTAEAALAPVRALADEHMVDDERAPDGHRWGEGFDAGWEALQARLRAVLPPAPTEGES